ncbi:MAG: hypothetical protein WC956_07435 [bacterium]
MKLTRREFGCGMLMGLCAMLLMRFFGRMGMRKFSQQAHARARYWSRADYLAG